MLKFTALLSLVTINELAFRADAIRSVLTEGGPVYGLTLLIYFAIALIFSLAVQRIEIVVNRWAGRVDVGRGLSARSGKRTSTVPVPRWAFPARY
jgi:hypothetical protein